MQDHSVSPTRLLLLLSLSLFLMTSSTRAGLLEDLITTVTSSLSDTLWRSETIDLLGHQCTLTIIPERKRVISLRYRGRVQCPDLADFSGRSPLVGSSSEATSLATKDFVKKALEKELITADEARIWL